MCQLSFTETKDLTQETADINQMCTTCSHIHASMHIHGHTLYIHTHEKKSRGRVVAEVAGMQAGAVVFRLLHITADLVWTVTIYIRNLKRVCPSTYF